MLKNQKAFTFVELLVTLSVFGVLAALAVPSFQDQIIRNQSAALAEDTLGAINFARLEAIKRGRPVTFCPANNTRDNCGNNWNNGWLVVVDTAATEAARPPVVANDAAVLKRWAAVNRNAEMNFSQSREFIRFNGLGALARVEGVNPAVVTTSIAHCNGLAARTITVSLAGMVTNRSEACVAY